MGTSGHIASGEERKKESNEPRQLEEGLRRIRVQYRGGDIDRREYRQDPLSPQAALDATRVSMGDEEGTRLQDLKPYQVNKKIMRQAKKDSIFMHCLPASRGEEVTNEVIDGKQSAVWLEALNRIHVQKSIIEWCLK